jgi:hypothetical protein
MGDWTSIALSRVSQRAISEGIAGAGAAWESVAHVTATTTLASAVRETGVVGLPLATLLDLVVMPGLPGEMALPVDGFPGLDDLHAGTYRKKLSTWQDQGTGRRLRIGIQADDSLRRFVREHSAEPAGQALLASRREYARTVHALVASGVDPRELEAGDALARLAAQAWVRGEQDVEALGAPRDLLWVDFDDVADERSDEARDLTQRVRRALVAAFGPAERRTVVHHGFYFYTPPQWALFQVMRRMPDVDQVFIVHDDGENPVFSTWRHYFRTDLSMPAPQTIPVVEAITPAAATLRGALVGTSVHRDPSLSVLECRSPAELVRSWRDEDLAEGGPPGRYAARAKDVERYVQRLGRSTGRSAPRLAELPVGSFLMALHRCVHQAADGSTSTRLDGDSVMDMVASGFLDLPADQSQVTTAVLRRVLPYFAGCRSGEEWRERAGLLGRTIENRVSPLGPRDGDQDDVDRIAAAAGNPTRLVPWADISVADARAVEAAVRRVVQLVEETSQRERVVLHVHLERIRARLERSLHALSAEERAAVEDKIRGFGVALDDEIDVGGLVDVVAMLLGRAADADPRDASERPDVTDVTELRGLDALGLARTKTDLHLTNLAGDVFPTPGGSVGWPFTLSDLRRSPGAVEPVTTELISIRSSTAALGDLYLFWLALDGVEDGRKVTLSWVSDQAGERRPLSPIVSLLTTPDVRNEVVRKMAGGISVRKVHSPADLPPDLERPVPATAWYDEDDIEAVLDEVDPRASASAVACPRRFALQWALGPTHSFGPEHLHSMLFGTVTSALVRDGHDNEFGARATTNDLWAHLTHGQRASSLDKSVVKSRHGMGGTKPEWVFTLGGSEHKSGPVDLAYQAAMTEYAIDDDDVAPSTAAFLPIGVSDPAVCGKCPVQTRCAHWADPKSRPEKPAT